MRVLERCLFLVCLVLTSSFARADVDRCGLTLNGPADLTSTREFAQQTAERIARPTESAELRQKNIKGYALLIGAMIASAAATTYFATILPPDVHFLSQLLAQVSTLGVYILGAPIWEPISSTFRKLAFNLRGQRGWANVVNREDVELETQWWRAQDDYSLNAQVSRGVVSNFLGSVKQNFYEARDALKINEVNYAADQIAEAAYRQRLLFRDMRPGEPVVTAAIRTTFTNHVVFDAAFTERVRQRLLLIDQNWPNPFVRQYYESLMESWLAPTLPANEEPPAGAETNSHGLGKPSEASLSH